MAKHEKRIVEFTLPYPDTPGARKAWNKEYSLNAIYAGKHHSLRTRDKRNVAWLVAAALHNQNVRKKIYDRPVRITFGWHDGLDIDNHAYYAKMIVDALKGYLLNNDSPRWYRACTHEFHDEEFIKIRLEEM